MQRLRHILCVAVFGLPVQASSVTESGLSETPLTNIVLLSFSDPAFQQERRAMAPSGAEPRAAYPGGQEGRGRPGLPANRVALSFGLGDLDHADREENGDPDLRPLGGEGAGRFRFIPSRLSGDDPDGAGFTQAPGVFDVTVPGGDVWPRANRPYGMTRPRGSFAAWGANDSARVQEEFLLRPGPQSGSGQAADTAADFGLTPAGAAARQFNASPARDWAVSAGPDAMAPYHLAEDWWLDSRTRRDRPQDAAAERARRATGQEGMVTFSVRF